VDGPGEIRKHAEVLSEARRLGRALLADSPAPQEPETVERFGLAGSQPR